MIRKIFYKLFSRSGQAIARKQKFDVIPVSQHHIQREKLSYAVKKVTFGLQKAGFSAYVVGGAVRDLLSGVSPKDFDVVTDATPEEVRKVFRRSRIIGRRFRIVHVMFGNETIEVTTFRGGAVAEQSDSGRIMRDNTFGSCEEDVMRRDFTVNALLYNPADETIIDYLDGVKDLKARQLVMIGKPADRYKEDPVRILRAIRLSAKLNMQIAEATRKPIREMSVLLENEPPARLFDELLKLLLSGHAYDCLRLLIDEGVCHYAFPFLNVVFSVPESEQFVQLALQSTDQRVNEGKHVSVGFLLAALLWYPVLQHWRVHQSGGDKPVHALILAIGEVEAQENKHVIIPRRFATTMKEIWSLQPRFQMRTAQRAQRLLEQPKFRAAYDFLALRAKVGEVPFPLVTWWESFQDATEDEREALLLEAKKVRKSGNNGNKDDVKKRRRPVNKMISEYTTEVT